MALTELKQDFSGLREVGVLLVQGLVTGHGLAEFILMKQRLREPEEDIGFFFVLWVILEKLLIRLYRQLVFAGVVEPGSKIVVINSLIASCSLY